MELRRFGTSDLFVSPLGFGSGHIGAEQMTDREAVYLLEQARDLGINLIDTARGYGLSEQRVGQFLKNRRHDVIL
ncbi:MAG TPA: aldo/keto reductase, partial [Exiguobacterium sp.]|nr:aldo/keto reductase [Exiguobacterium sp.]